MSQQPRLKKAASGRTRSPSRLDPISNWRSSCWKSCRPVDRHWRIEWFRQNDCVRDIGCAIRVASGRENYRKRSCPQGDVRRCGRNAPPCGRLSSGDFGEGLRRDGPPHILDPARRRIWLDASPSVLRCRVVERTAGPSDADLMSFPGNWLTTWGALSGTEWMPIGRGQHRRGYSEAQPQFTTVLTWQGAHVDRHCCGGLAICRIP